MNEEEQKQSESGTVDNTDYIAAIKELKEKSVSKQILVFLTLWRQLYLIIYTT